MKVTILGSGNFIPNLDRKAPGYLLELNNHKILLDCGSGTLLQLEKIKSGLYQELDYIFISHLHPDHTSDLFYLMQVLEWHPSLQREKELVMVGPKGLNKFYHKFIVPIIGSNPQRPFKITVQEIKDNLFFPDFQVQTMKAKHPGHCLIYKFITDHKKLVYSGDTGYLKKIVGFAREADLLILECTHPPQEKNGWDGHLNAEQCADIANKSGCKKLFLTHLHKEEDDNQKKLEMVKGLFPGEVYLAEDLLEVKV